MTSITDCCLDLTFIADSSGSINSNDWVDSKGFAVNVVKKCTIASFNVRVAFVRFGTNADVRWGFKKYQDELSLTTAIRGVPFSGGGTNLKDALHVTCTQVYRLGNGARAGAHRAAIILTDGYTSHTQLTINEAKLCKDKGIRLMAVGVGDYVNVGLLQDIISSRSDDYYSVDEALPSIVENLKKICQNTTLHPSDTSK